MLNGYRVLIVEDSAAAYLFMAQILTDVGYRVSVAPDGNEGMKRALSEIPHCILLDIILPDISGFEVCRRLRTIDPQHRHPIILVSSKNMPLDHTWGLKQGADYYLVKPFSQERLVQTVQYVLSPTFQPPDTTQQLLTGYHLEHSDHSIRPAVITWTFLVPARKEEPELLTTANPFETAVVIRDKFVRRVYDSIDNHKNVRDICLATGLPSNTVREALRALLAMGRIQLHKPDGTQTDVSLLLKD